MRTCYLRKMSSFTKFFFFKKKEKKIDSSGLTVCLQSTVIPVLCCIVYLYIVHIHILHIVILMTIC